jgi:hypothetical protein
LDWRGDKLAELIRDQAQIHPALKLCYGFAAACRAGNTEGLRRVWSRQPDFFSLSHNQRIVPGDWPCERGKSAARRVNLKT